MRVLVIWRRLSIGGVTSGWRNRAQFFKKMGIEVEFLFYKDNGGQSLFDGTFPYYITSNHQAIKRIIRKNHYDLIILIDFKEMYPVLKKSRFKGALILESRVPIRRFVKKQFQDLAGLSPSGIVVPSHYQKSLVRRSLTQKVPIHVISNGTDTTLFKPSLSKSEHVPVNFPQNKKIIGCVGRISVGKNHNLFFDIAAKLAKQRKDVVFWIVGGNRDDKETKALLRKMTTLRIKDKVYWQSNVSYTDMPAVYVRIGQSGGCLLSATNHESFGNTFTEAMACRCPVVAPRHTAIPEVIDHQKTGLLYRPRSVKHATQLVNGLLNNKKQRQRMIKQALNKIDQVFSIDKKATEYAQLIQEKAGRKSR